MTAAATGTEIVVVGAVAGVGAAAFAATTVALRSARTTRAGLRTSCTDGEHPIGPEPRNGSSGWRVGQGGYGPERAASPGRLSADWALGLDTRGATRAGIDTDALVAGA